MKTQRSENFRIYFKSYKLYGRNNTKILPGISLQPASYVGFSAEKRSSNGNQVLMA